MISVKFAESSGGIHGVVKEMMLSPPENIRYSHFDSSMVRKEISTIPFIDKEESDIIEGFDTPVLTEKKWIYTGSNFSQMVSFDIFGTYPDRTTRLRILEKILEKDNCKKLVFPSNAGFKTIFDHENMKNKNIFDKCAVVPYAFRKIKDELVDHKESDKVKLLFIGSQFVRKGGKQLIDAFEILNKKYDVELNIVSNFAAWNRFTSDKDTSDARERISKMENVKISPTKREYLLESYYPDSDIFVFPTMWETFGFVPIEAMAYGMPVVSTNWPTALPEIVEDKKSGFLIDIMKHDFMKAVLKNEDKYSPDGFYQPPKEFSDYFVKELVEKLSLLIEDSALRRKMGMEGLRIARTKFSFENRNRMMKKIYEESMG